MMVQQGDLALLHDPIAQRLLSSTNLAHLAYTWTDGTPRTVPIWFHWDGAQVILGTPPNAPKLKAILNGTQVALSIDSDGFPWNVLLIRGSATVKIQDGVGSDYAQAAERYFGVEQGQAWTSQLATMSPQMARIAIQPEWVGILDFEQRFPSALAKAMASIS